jgi:hypothetical protein
MDWPIQTFECGPVQATVVRQTIRSYILSERIRGLLPKPVDDLEAAYQRTFLRMVTQTESVTGLDLTWPDSGASPEAWCAAYEAFSRMDPRLADAFYEALEAVDRPFNDEEMWPSHYLSEADRKNRASAGSNAKIDSGSASPSSSPSKNTG